MNYTKKIIALFLIILSVACLASCKQSDNTEYFDNENDPLLFSTQALDEVFNPFFSTSATDSQVVGMTQIGMLSNNEKGEVAYGDSEATVVKDLQIVTEGTPDVDQTTTYYFVLKNNVRFSNGSYLTIKDVLFNLYVYLDPAYTGSATMYSTDIVGLKQYRTQESTEKEQDSFNDQFVDAASTRLTSLVDACENIIKDYGDTGLTAVSFKSYLLDEYSLIPSYENVVNDYEKALELFRKELESDYTNSMDSYSDTKFYDEKGKEYANLFTTDVESFLYNEGYITWNKKEGKLYSSLTLENDVESLKTWTKEQAINKVFANMIPNKIDEVLLYWATSSNILTYITNQEMENYFAENTRIYKNISGIKYANKDASVDVNGTNYNPVTENQDGTISGNQVLSITINGVDPKAIWNFSFAVAPMYYYSDKNHIDSFDYEENFGVEYASQSFMENVVNAPNKIGVPVGAGPYAASKASGGITGIEAGDFLDKNVVYFERNPYFIFDVVIKKVRFQVVASSQMTTALYASQIDFAEPNSNPKTIAELNSKKKDGIGNQSIQTSGYGYIGINAGKVPDIKVRQAIMHSINTLETVNYYQNTATAIYRSMSRSSWAYPTSATSYYPYIGGPVPSNLDVVNPDYKDYVNTLGKKAGDYLTEEEQKDFITMLVEDAGYKKNANGVYAKGNSVLKYTFTVAGEVTDHPAWDALWHSSEILNECGMQITVTTDAQALKKLSTGSLTVWAAAWGSTIDPDMYQVYHIDSNANSVLNWGYKQIKQNVNGKYDTELDIIERLSDLIDKGRATTDQSERAKIYSDALDLVMELAVELPTYQRDDLFAYNTNKIDVNTFNKNTSPYKGLTSDLHSLSLVTKEK